MDRGQYFVTLRYFIIEEDPVLFDPEPLPEVKGHVVLDVLREERDWLANGVKYTFVGFVGINPNHGDEFPNNRFVVGKIAKYRQAHVGERVPGDVVEHMEDDWIPLIVVFDTITQTIYVRKDWRFGTTQQICSAIESGLRKPILDAYNYRIFVEPKPTEGAFWEIIESHKKIYRLELRLVSPNILQTNVKARDALSALKSLYGQDEISLKMKNDSGSLKVPKQPTSDYVEYIEKGEGTWRTTTEGEHGGKKSHSSAEVAEEIELVVSQEATEERPSQLEFRSGSRPVAIQEEGRRYLVSQIFRVVSSRRGS